jgi:phosphatidylserine/phosphatidylglycerophosphate/cardiolipin synthase-like enzyme
VRVQVLLDKSQRRDKYGRLLANSGIANGIDAAHAIAHNRVRVIDGVAVITGSCNFTKAAEEQNTENLLVIQSRELAAPYVRNCHSESYAGRARKSRGSS